MTQISKLHIGCGKCYIPGWQNVDIFSSVRADVYADMTALPFDRESFDVIYASHVLEHSHRHMVLATLSHWRDLLKKDGVLRIAVPNFSAIVDWYRNTGRVDDVMGLLYGGQNHPKNNHFITFDALSLNRSLVQVGFLLNNIKLWNWKETEHSHFDDYSQCFLPHMQKDSGMLMSLNVEAKK